MGFIGFIMAVIDDPALILPPCKGTFADTFINNYIVTSEFIPGKGAPIFITLATGKKVAESLGLFTIITAIKLSVKNPIFLLDNLTVSLVSIMANALLAGGIFSSGLVIGSAFGAALCQQRN